MFHKIKNSAGLLDGSTVKATLCVKLHWRNRARNLMVMGIENIGTRFLKQVSSGAMIKYQIDTDPESVVI